MVKIKIVGTSHISTKSHLLIRKAMNELNPDVVAVESKSNVMYIKIKLSIFQYMYLTLLRKQGMMGKEKTKIKKNEQDMNYSVKEAKIRKIPILAIDMPPKKWLKKLDKIPLKEKIILIWALFIGLISTTKASAKENNNIGINKNEQIQEDHNRKQLPVYYKIHIDERDKTMADNIKKIAKKHNKILVVVGLGHKKGIQNHLKNKSLL